MLAKSTLHKTLLSALGITCISSTLSAVSYEMDAPNLQQDKQVSYAQEGIRIRVTDPGFPYGKIDLIADGMRWDQETEEFFFTGNVRILHPHYQLHAQHLSFNLKDQTGQAFNVELHVTEKGQRVKLTCERIEINPSYFNLYQLHTNSGHGSLFHIKAANIHVRRADKPHPHRDGITAQIDDISIKHPRFKIGSVPVFWFPILYRDFRLDYPWTKIELGHESDRGAFIRAWIGFDLPRIGDLSSHVRMRNDHYELSGKGYGPELYWSSPTIGSGSAYWFRMDPEKLYGDTTGGFPDLDDLAFNNLYDKMSGTLINRRQAEAWEIEHTLNFSNGAIYARYADLPNAIDGTLDSDQFRADHHESIMEEQPLARQGLNASWRVGHVSIDYQRAIQPFKETRLADKEHALQFLLSPLRITNNLYTIGDISLSQFETNDAGIAGSPRSEAWRLNAQVGLQYSDWYPKWGFDASLGVKLLSYDQLTLNEIEQSDNSAQYAFTEFGFKTRLVADFENGIKHTFTPRIAFDLRAKSSGDTIPVYDVGDDEHLLIDDQQTIVVSFENQISKMNRYFQMENAFHFALRDEDRTNIQNDGTVRFGDDAFLLSKNSFSGVPLERLHISGDLDYNGVTRTWTTLDARLNYTVSDHLSFSWQAARTPASSSQSDYWQHEPGMHIKTNRYNVDYQVTLREDGDDIDGYRLAFDRKMIDGSLGLAFEMDRDFNGNIEDRRVEFFLRIGSWGGL